MKSSKSRIALLFVATLSIASAPAETWITEKHDGYTFLFKEADKGNKADYVKLVDNGIGSVKSFFGDSYKHNFEIYVHPNRQSLEQQWQKDWGMPDFKSECWMVASGTATKLDMISPKQWDSESCEHHYANHTKTQQLITHELFHVYHGQHNPSPDFSEVTNIDWFVEGFATYASGQCDAARIAEVRRAIETNTAPGTLNDFWKGQQKYGLSGSMVMYIDKKYGRTKFKDLLPLASKDQVLTALGISELDLLSDWTTFVKNYR